VEVADARAKGFLDAQKRFFDSLFPRELAKLQPDSREAREISPDAGGR
jgi:hypothetical protein